ncbi:hypothetical protein C8J57DRAFT_1529835 [Mycena rebaudengoi]|nr:hypothetical protein C8J57DRAFT_1529835 [Mycena rebaudengoi]
MTQLPSQPLAPQALPVHQCYPAVLGPPASYLSCSPIYWYLTPEEFDVATLSDRSEEKIYVVGAGRGTGLFANAIFRAAADAQVSKFRNGHRVSAQTWADAWAMWRVEVCWQRHQGACPVAKQPIGFPPGIPPQPAPPGHNVLVPSMPGPAATVGLASAPGPSTSAPSTSTSVPMPASTPAPSCVPTTTPPPGGDAAGTCVPLRRAPWYTHSGIDCDALADVVGVVVIG